MCDDSIRDGSDTRTIPEDNSQCLNSTCDSDYRFGMHENNKYYSDCKKRQRNKRIFTADQVEFFFIPLIRFKIHYSRTIFE
jgi:hypothetical protein